VAICAFRRMVSENVTISDFFWAHRTKGHFVFASFASAFLLKVGFTISLVLLRCSEILFFQLLRPEFAGLLSSDDETKIFDLIGRLIQTLSSPDVAIDDRHTPKLHARFLAGLLSKYQDDAARTGRLPPQNPPSSHTVSHGPYGPMHPSGSSSQVFSVAPPQAGSSSSSVSQDHIREGSGNQSFSTSSSTSSQLNDDGTTFNDTSTYQHDGAYFRGGTGLLASEDSLMNYGISEEEMLAALQVIKNPSWWTNMMMPGYTALFLLLSFLF
jgi:hypothetical protein